MSLSLPEGSTPAWGSYGRVLVPTSTTSAPLSPNPVPFQGDKVMMLALSRVMMAGCAQRNQEGDGSSQNPKNQEPPKRMSSLAIPLWTPAWISVLFASTSFP